MLSHRGPQAAADLRAAVSQTRELLRVAGREVGGLDEIGGDVEAGLDEAVVQLGRQDVIVRFPLTEKEARLSLDELARVHPVPGR